MRHGQAPHRDTEPNAPDEPTAGNHPDPNLSPIPLRHLLVPPAHDRTWLIHTPQGSPPAPTHISRPTGTSYEDPEIAPSRPNIRGFAKVWDRGGSGGPWIGVGARL